MTATQKLPPDVTKLREQLQIDQAPDAKTRTPLFDMVGLQGYLGKPFSSRRISLNQMYEMREDAVLAFAQLMSMVAILTGKWEIQCNDARKAAFIDNSLRRIYGRLILQFFLARDFGFQALVKQFGLMKPDWQYVDKNDPDGPKVKKVWGEAVDALVWEPFVPLKPESVEPAWTEGGAFNGIKLNASGFFLPGIVNEPIGGDGVQRQRVDVKHSLWIVNERDGSFGSIWGKSQYRYAFKFWWAYELALAILNRSVERKGDPVIVVRYPNGSSEYNGKEVDNQTIAFAIGKLARSGSVLAIPSEAHDDDEGGKGVPKWKVEYLSSDEKFERLEQILSYLDTQKFHAMMLPEQAVTEGKGGTSSRNVAEVMGTRSAEMQIAVQTEHDSIINQYMIPQLAEAHRPILSDAPARKVTKSFGEDEVQLLRELLRSRANSDSGKIPIDWARAAEILNVPLLEGEGLASFYQMQKTLTERAEQTKPPEREATPGGNAGVSDTGFYYDARELIELQDHTLLSSLPATKHYEDRAVLAHTRLIRKLWYDLLSEQYEHFARHIESDEVELSDVELASGDSASRRKKIVDAIMASWKFTGKTYQSTVKRTATALGSVFSRAGELELRRSRLSLDDWNPDEKELAKWVKANAASMVRKVESTTRKQLNAFLLEQMKNDVGAPEIAAEIRKHFSEFPSWRADLIAREEVRRFYNVATIFAAQAKGRQLQALDARLGPTDDPCIRRNGQLFAPDAAFKEEAKEHPRGTLAWRILPGEQHLSIERVTADEADGWAARFDREKDVIYLREGLAPQQEGAYLLQIGDWLESVA